MAILELLKPQRRLLSLAKRGKVERLSNNPVPFDMLQFHGFITSDGEITPEGKAWLKNNEED